MNRDQWLEFKRTHRVLFCIDHGTHRDKDRARRMVTRAIKSGQLIRPDACSVCGSKTAAIQAHHPDYSKPLDIQWLCTGCHGIAHQTAIGRTFKQTTRLKKIKCQDCGYTARVTAKWIDEAGAPLCPCNSEPMQVQPTETEE